VARRGAIGIGSETRCSGAAGMRFQPGGDGIRAADRADAPGEGEDIAPVAVAMKQALDRAEAAIRKGVLEPREPVIRDRRQGSVPASIRAPSLE